MDAISSLQNEKVKLAHSLQSRPRARRKERKIVLEGTRLVGDALQSGNKPLYVLFRPDAIDYGLLNRLQARNITLYPVTSEVLKHVSDTQNPQGVVAVFPLPLPPLPRNPQRVLILDNLRDPGNLGTVLRTAAAAGVSCVLLSPGCADPYNPKTLRSGMGAHFRVPLVEAPWDDIRAYCDPLHVYLTAGDGGARYDQADWSAGWAVIIGSEAHGASPEAGQIATTRIRIPMAAGTESLNAAVAAGIVLYEAARQSGVFGDAD